MNERRFEFPFQIFCRVPLVLYCTKTAREEGLKWDVQRDLTVQLEKQAERVGNSGRRPVSKLACGFPCQIDEVVTAGRQLHAPMSHPSVAGSLFKFLNYFVLVWITCPRGFGGLHQPTGEAWTCTR